MSYDPNQPGWSPPPTPAPNAGYQPPEGTNPGNIPPQAPEGTWGQAPNPGYGAQGYAGQPASYGYGAYPGPMAPSTSGWAIASLVSSIASYLGFLFIGGILGVIFGHIALNEIKRSPQPMEGRGMAMAGLILGYVNIGLTLCGVVGFFAVGASILSNLH